FPGCLLRDLELAAAALERGNAASHRSLEGQTAPRLSNAATPTRFAGRAFPAGIPTGSRPFPRGQMKILTKQPSQKLGAWGRFCLALDLAALRIGAIAGNWPVWSRGTDYPL